MYTDGIFRIYLHAVHVQTTALRSSSISRGLAGLFSIQYIDKTHRRSQISEVITLSSRSSAARRTLRFQTGLPAAELANDARKPGFSMHSGYT